MWENIVDGELARTAELPVASRVAMLGNKVRGLGKVYAAGGGGSGSSSNRYDKFKHEHKKNCLDFSIVLIFPLRYFPVDFLVRKLEVFSSKVGAEHSWVFKALLDIGFSLPKILDVYNRYD